MAVHRLNIDTARILDWRPFVSDGRAGLRGSPFVDLVVAIGKVKHAGAIVVAKRHIAPVVGGAGVPPCVGAPGFVSRLAWARNGVEYPAQRAGVHIEGANVAGRRGMGLRVAAADDDQVLVDAARRGERDGLLFPWLAQAFTEVDAPALAEARDWF